MPKQQQYNIQILHPSPTACSREHSAKHISPNKCPISSALNHSLDKGRSAPTPYTLNHSVHLPTKHMHGSAPQHFPDLPGCQMLKAHYTQALPRSLSPYLSSVCLSLPLSTSASMFAAPSPTARPLQARHLRRQAAASAAATTCVPLSARIITNISSRLNTEKENSNQ